MKQSFYRRQFRNVKAKVTVISVLILHIFVIDITEMQHFTQRFSQLKLIKVQHTQWRAEA